MILTKAMLMLLMDDERLAMTTLSLTSLACFYVFGAVVNVQAPMESISLGLAMTGRPCYEG
jgi:hypothetical protein